MKGTEPLLRFHSTKEVSKVCASSWRPGASRCFHSTKEVSKAMLGGSSSAGRIRVSIPLRKFPRGNYCNTRIIPSWVSIPLRKFPRYRGSPEYARGTQVSIPLRKFPRLSKDLNIIVQWWSFHSTKEVSKAASNGRYRVERMAFPFH